MWVYHPLQVNQPCHLSLSSFRGRQMSSKLQLYVCMLPRLRWRHLANAYGVKADVVRVGGKQNCVIPLLSQAISECFRDEVKLRCMTKRCIQILYRAQRAEAELACHPHSVGCNISLVGAGRSPN